MSKERTFRVIITTVSEKLFDGEALHVAVPSVEGELTILHGHEPLVTLLQRGVIRVQMSKETEETFPVEKGVLETTGQEVTVLV